MSHIFKIFSVFIPTIISVIIVFYFWQKINFQFNNPNEIVGYYSINNYSVLNDNIRYLIFIIFPSITFFFNFLYWKKKKIKDLRNLLIFDDKSKILSKISIVNLFFVIFLTAVYILSLDFNFGPIDLFHDGQVLVGAKNFLLKGNIFKENYIVTSLFIDILNPVISWKLFGIENLTSYRLFIILLNLLSLLTLIIFLYNLTNYSLIIDKNLKVLFFSFLTILAIIFFKNSSFSFRDITFFIFFIATLLFDISKQKGILCLIIGLLPLSSLLISLDRGVFLLPVYFVYCLYLFLSKQLRSLFYIFISVFSSILIFYVIIGNLEFKYFIINSLDIIKSSELLNGIIHPNLFTDEANSSRATKSLLTILLNIFICIYFLLNKKIDLSNFKLVMILMLVTSIIYYKIGLTRSDGGHIKQGTSIASFQLIIFISYFVIKSLETKLIFLKSNKIFYIFYTIIILTIIFSNFNYTKLNNFIYLKDRISNYLNQSDKKFLNIDELLIIKKLQALTKTEKCFQVFSYETGIQYYLNKKNCTNFYHIMNMGSKNNQMLFINQIRSANPKYILTGGNYSDIGNMKNDNSDNLYPKNRFPYIQKYIDEKYKIFEKYKKWNILIRKGS